jgi:hypothetical protein
MAVVTSGATAGLPAPLSPYLGDVLDTFGFNNTPNKILRENRGSILAAAAAIPKRRAMIDDAIDKDAARLVQPVRDQEVTVIGGGLQAAIFCAAYWKATGKKPMVLEQRPRLGGVFALSKGPAFYLNSRNRPEGGEPGPGKPGPLNTIGGAIELADISGAEYPPQDDLAFVIRLTLALYSTPITNARVGLVTDRDLDGMHAVRFTYKGLSFVFRSKNLIFATGVGEPELPFSNGTTFEAFLLQTDRTDYPISRWGDRVAVIGAGDSGSCTVEYLLGQGPTTKYDTASSAFPQRIVWFGQSCTTREQYMEGARSRYAGIGRYMPRVGDPGYFARVIPKPKALRVAMDDKRERLLVLYREGGVVGDPISEQFDSVIVCAGYRDTSEFALVPELRVRRRDVVQVDGVPCGTRCVNTNIYSIGPCAGLPVTDGETSENSFLAKVPQNSVALFRYNRKTQLLAEHLAASAPPEEEDDRNPF